MSYDIYLTDSASGKTLEVENGLFVAGGVFQLGGTRRMWLNCTYNYARLFKRVLGEAGIRSLYGKTAAETTPALQAAVALLADNASGDFTDGYWEPTEGNAKRALLALLAWAQLRPDGVWSGD